jgi:hypothetical protein
MRLGLDVKINGDLAYIYAHEFGELTLHTLDESGIGISLRAHRLERSDIV